MRGKYLIACGLVASQCGAATWSWDLPKGFPEPWVPADNPMTFEKVRLGRYLFYDKRMSADGTMSCATCHQQKLAFTDGLRVGVGVTGERHSRGAMSLVNVAFSGALTWVDQAPKTLEDQALVPMFGEHPVELGLRRDGRLVATLHSDSRYAVWFPQAFPGVADPFTIENATRALACFERSIISARSPYDRYHYGGDDTAVSEAAKRGEVLFFNQNLSCFRCHGGYNFSDATVSKSSAGRDIQFHVTAVSKTGKFKSPTLRNIAVTAPYMHDGTIPQLDGVIDHYATGGRARRDRPDKDPLMAGFKITPAERADLIEFLKSLTDEEVLHDPRFSDPW